MTNTLVADHAMSHILNLENVTSGESITTSNSIGVYEMAALLNLRNNKQKFDFRGKSYVVRLLLNGAMMSKLNSMPVVELKGDWKVICKRLKDEGYIKLTLMFLRDVMYSSDPDSVAKLFFEVIPQGKKKKKVGKKKGGGVYNGGNGHVENSRFSLTFSSLKTGAGTNGKGGVPMQGKCQMSASHSPTMLLTGQNQLPLELVKADGAKIIKARDKAEAIGDMFSLPVYILKEILFGGSSEGKRDKVEGYMGSPLFKAWRNGQVSFSWVQVAGYTTAFESKDYLQRAMLLLSSIYSADFVNPRGSKGKGGVNLAHELGVRIDKKENSYVLSKGMIAGVSYFKLTKKYGGSNMVSVGIYDDENAYDYEDRQKEVKDCIRLDLTLFSTGVKVLAKKLKFKGKWTDFKMNKVWVVDFFEQIFERDPTGGIIFETLFVHYFNLPDLLLFQSKHWEEVFEYMKLKGYANIVDSMKNEGLSFREACLQNEVEDPTNLSKDINKHIRQTVLTGSGNRYPIDFNVTNISFAMWQTARLQLYNMYGDHSQIIKWYEGEDTNYDPAEDSKVARKDARRVARQLCTGKILAMPYFDSQNQDTVNKDKPQDEDFEVPF